MPKSIVWEYSAGTLNILVIIQIKNLQGYTDNSVITSK